MNPWLRLLFLLVSAGSLVACTGEVQETPLDLGYSYYPLALGQERIYEADSIIYRRVGTGVRIDSVRHYVREVVQDTFRAASGSLRYRVARFEGPNRDGPWVQRLAVAVARDERIALRQEDNLPYIKLVFPLRTGASWDGNRYFEAEGLRQVVAGESIEIFKEWQSTAVAVDEPDRIAGIDYDSVAIVRHADFESLVDLRRVEEKYLRGYGLVYREMHILDSQCQACCGGDTGACLALDWRDRGEAGFILRERLIEFR